MYFAATLMREAEGGDERAFMHLLGPVMPSAYRLAYAMLRSGPDAEDAVQDAVLKAWKHFDRFRQDSGIRPWLLTIVANECWSLRRSRWFSVLRAAEPDQPAVEPYAADDLVDLHRALYKLPYDLRLALVLRCYLDLPFEEVGRTLGITAKAAKSRTQRALERLRLLPEVLGDR